MAFDLDAVVAENEGPPDKREKFSFTFDGHEYELPNEFDALTMDLASHGDNIAVLRRIMKPEDFALLQQSPKMLKRETLWALLTGYFNHIVGLNAGESSASTRSSKSTARPSKRTSKSTTRSRSRN